MKFCHSASLAIDARTGAIYSPVSHHQLNKTPDIDCRLKIAGLQFTHSPLKRCYDGSQIKPAVESPEKNTEIIQNTHPPITLGFLSSVDKNIIEQEVPAQNYLGFKKGFLS